MHGLARIRLDPTLAGLYTLAEKDAMLVIEHHTNKAAAEEARKQWQTNQ